MEVTGNVANSVTIKDGIASKVTIEIGENGEPKISCSVVFLDEIKRTSQQTASDESKT